jgi:cytochrome c peroxidase
VQKTTGILPAQARPPRPNSTGDTYASFHERDSKIWQAQTDAFIEQGNQIFHSAQLLGSTIGVSCALCHPNAANTQQRVSLSTTASTKVEPVATYSFTFCKAGVR